MQQSCLGVLRGVESATKGACVLGNLRGLLPQALEESFIEGMHAFSRRIPAFDREDAILSGVESRTSSPVRLVRDPKLLVAAGGIYPCGEGAGYAGGIMSAAMDGLKVAEVIMRDMEEQRAEFTPMMQQYLQTKERI